MANIVIRVGYVEIPSPPPEEGPVVYVCSVFPEGSAEIGFNAYAEFDDSAATVNATIVAEAIAACGRSSISVGSGDKKTLLGAVVDG